ncbi:MAG: MBL fold metallo-hydrolase [Chloroflexi bacterium]|nr:MBL fold metallo-hydrolase [Chloroflexota bacterium]
MILSRVSSLGYRGALEVVSGVYQLTVKAANMILIAGDKLTLIDTGFRGSSRRLATLLQFIGRRLDELELIIITHNHYDHSGGAAELKKLTGARVAAHNADIAGSDELIPYPEGVRRLVRLPVLSALRPALTIGSGTADIELSGGEMFEALGGLHIIHTPGHTPGSICVYAPEKKLLAVGDALDKHGGAVFPPHKTTCTNWQQALESARALSQLDCEALCFGHGRPFVSSVRSKMEKLRARIDALS